MVVEFDSNIVDFNVLVLSGVPDHVSHFIILLYYYFLLLPLILRERSHWHLWNSSWRLSTSLRLDWLLEMLLFCETDMLLLRRLSI